MSEEREPKMASAPILARIPPPIWAILYVAIAIVISAWLEVRPIATLHQPMIGTILIVLALTLIISAQINFRRAGTEIMPASPANKALVMTGPYGFTRNPMYLGLVLLTLGIAFIVATPPFFLVPIAVFFTNNAVVIPFEEAKMERQFGDEYRAYKSKVRRWL
jgi:protein-S-isoprenylcysteine O-methyltransferase Ste14